MAAAALVAQGLGVALLPDWAPMWQGGFNIARIPLPERAPVRRVGVIWGQMGPRASVAEAFLLQAQSVFGQPATAAVQSP